MRNTGIRYNSKERMPTVLSEMAELLPPLSGEQLAVLEADLLANGCYAPVIVNEDMVIVDGHNRQKLCQQHGIPYEMAVFSFVDLLEAKQWALDTQKGRRNLDKWELGKIALKLKPDIEARARRNMSAGGGDQKSEDAKSGLATLPNPISSIDTRKELAKAKKEIRQGDEDSARRHKIAGLFCKAFEKAVLLTPTEENVRIWAECTRMNQDEIRDSAQEARELAEVFTAIANILGTMLKDQGGNESIA